MGRYEWWSYGMITFDTYGSERTIDSHVQVIKAANNATKRNMVADVIISRRGIAFYVWFLMRRIKISFLWTGALKCENAQNIAYIQ